MSKFFRVASLMSVVLAAPTANLLAQARIDGWTYTMNMTIDSGRADHRISMAMRHQVAGSRYRMEFVQISGSSEAAGAEGMYNIMNSADTTMTMVMPPQHMAMVSSLAGVLDNPMVRMTMKQHVTNSAVSDLGPGGTLLGHATHHYQYTTTGSLEITMMGETCTQRLDGSTDVWVAPDVDLLSAMAATATYLQGISGADVLNEQSASRPELKGAPLKTVSRMTRLNQSGQPITITSTMEIVELKHGPLDASVFEIPADYQKTDMREMMKSMPAGMLDSAMKAGAAGSTKRMCQ